MPFPWFSFIGFWSFSLHDPPSTRACWVFPEALLRRVSGTFLLNTSARSLMADKEMCEDEEQEECQEEIKLLSIKTHAREVKRLQFEKLFLEQQAIKQQMAQIQEELQQLDEEIDNLEKSVHYDAIESVESVGALTERATQWEVGDVITDPQRSNPMPHRYHVPVQAPPSEGLLTSTKKGTIEAYLSSASNEISRNSNNSSSASSFKTIPENTRYNSCSGVTFAHPPSINDASATGQQPAHYEWTAQINHLLHTAFKIRSFRENQEDIINSTLLQKDVFVIMRTGGGKSLWYVVLALILVHSPF